MPKKKNIQITQITQQNTKTKKKKKSKKRCIIERETAHWGVAVPGVEIKDVKLPQNMQRAMAAEAESERERRAKIISAKGEVQAANELANAADRIANSPGALQLRYLHTLVKIAAEKNSTILFPLPMEVMRGMKYFNDMAIANQTNNSNNSNGLPTNHMPQINETVEEKDDIEIQPQFA